MMGEAFMAEASVSRLDTVIAGIRGYLREQLSELDGELEAARLSVAELTEQLTSRQSSVAMLMAGRDLLVSKLAELNEAWSDPASDGHEQASEAEAPTPDAAAEGDTAVSPPTDAPAATAEPGPRPVRRPNASQRAVLEFLSGTPGVHKVSEIALGVNGPDAGNAAIQTIRRALGVLVEAGHVAKSVQAGTAFYSAASAPSEDAAYAPDGETPAPHEAPSSEPATPRKAPSATRKATASNKAAAKSTRARSPRSATSKGADNDTTTAAATADTAAAASERPLETAARRPTAKKTPKRSTAKKAAPSSGDKPVRADRPKIIAALLASAEPQSASEVSHAVMGAEWKPSDATNFRMVLKNMVTQGIVATYTGEDSRTRYALAASS
ncbi:hypothetical protein [Streptacidiphilus sp. EB103A]|uniref:hypothetical protein n=1 Tax=Streptacidiphilus sp. EB103A TaxID=3156275 RepID=UPI003517BE0A